MKLKTRLTRLAAAIAEQASRNPEFAQQLEEILGCNPVAGPKSSTKSQGTRKGGRRAPAVVDPVAIAESDPTGLRNALEPLELGQLLDIVAEYGMDPGKLVMKWKDRNKVIERIIDVSTSRATKGDAFRSD
ncbi:hypothetical protein GCM10011360_25330 [Primorskyibacter flagellatus]|uniref:Uncharacterized protein n=1 Tax=Primorskyibacter flagellatus TaxID=1387277 RepID=A0A917A9D3_9RHOB|nr:hypothetical protein [Primorskyibacter flagellatus]GGE36484.1 hypothetical protein GCM10011360_25330 [Primorskyibacter flagellatus]